MENATTETSLTWANADGTLTSQVSGGPVRVKQADKWVSINSALRARADGTVGATVPSSDLSLFGGDTTTRAAKAGDRPLISAKRPGGKALTLGWRGKLPKPVLQGDTAVYRDVSPGTDMQVQLTSTGFQQHMVLKQKPSEPVSYTVPLQFTGLTARTAAGGGAEFIDEAGEVVGAMAAPSMWDSDLDNVSELPIHTANVSYTLTPRDYGVDITLTPDMKFLTDTAIKYPVTVDPDIFFHGPFDTYVKKGMTTDASAATEIAVGTDGTGNPARAYLNWDPASFRGKQVVEAHLALWNTRSATCAEREIWIYSSTSATAAARWTAQPTVAATRSGATVGTKAGPDCSSEGYIETPRHALDSLAQAWANTVSGSVGMALIAPSETDVHYFKRFRSGNNTSGQPVMTITYNSYPVVNSRGTLPAIGCVTGPTRPYINTLTPTLTATISDADGSPVQGVFEWYTVGGAKVGDAITVAKVNSAGTGVPVTTTVPAGAFTDGSSYSWRVTGNDSLTNGAWSTACEFTIDATAPAALPTVSSPNYPASQWSGTATPTTGTFTFGAAGVTDVTKYSYRLDNGPTTVVATNQLGGSATASITPSTLGAATLFVNAYDRAGNVSPTKAYSFLVGDGSAQQQANLPLLDTLGIATKEGPAAPDASCLVGSNRPVVNTITPQVWATFTHPSDTTINADFQYAGLDGVPLGVEPVDAEPISGRISAWVPEGMLTDGQSYKWRVRTRNVDSTVAGNYSGWCEFTVHAALGRDATGTGFDDFTPPSESIPDVADPAEEVNSGPSVPETEDEPPYEPAADTGQVADEADPDESDVPPDAFSVQSSSTPPDYEPAVVVPQDGPPPSEVVPGCPIDVNEAANGTVSGSANLPDGQYSCQTPVTSPPATSQAQVAAATATEESDGSFDDSVINAESGPDTPEAFAAAQSGTSQEQGAAAAAASRPGDLKATKLPSQCGLAAEWKWQVGRYDACQWWSTRWSFYTLKGQKPELDGWIDFNEYHYARQSAKRGTWDFHVYLKVTDRWGKTAKVRAYTVSSGCSSFNCTSRFLASSGSLSKIGNVVQFTATYTPRVDDEPDKRLQHTGFVKYSVFRAGDYYSSLAVAVSNWVRCDKALKGSSTVGCVVPNYIPTLYYSRRGRYPDLANHIYEAQKSGLPGEPGSIFDGEAGSSQALRRIYDKNKRSRNGNKACPSGFRAKVGAPVGTSCDEYPFRSTYQGAYTADPNNNRPRTFSFCKIRPLYRYTPGPDGYSRCFINAKQNSDGGNWVGRMYGTGDGGMRLLDNDKFYVRIS